MKLHDLYRVGQKVYVQQLQEETWITGVEYMLSPTNEVRDVGYTVKDQDNYWLRIEPSDVVFAIYDVGDLS